MRKRVDPRVRFDRHWRISTATWKGSPCWDWVGQRHSRTGYPLFMGERQKTVVAMRWIYEQIYGALGDLVPDHLCRRIVCVNPEHAEAVTQTENKRRGTGWAGINARKTQCIRGHPLTGDNVRLVRCGKEQRFVGRSCKACDRERRRAKKQLGVAS